MSGEPLLGANYAIDTHWHAVRPIAALHLAQNTRGQSNHGPPEWLGTAIVVRLTASRVPVTAR